MIKLIWDRGFERKLKKYIQKHPDKLEKIKNKLMVFEKDPFVPELKNHKLSGKLKDMRAIVIEYDCRIIFKFVKRNEALLIST